MFAFLQQILDKLNFSFNFLNRKNSPSKRIKQANVEGDNVGRDKITHHYHTKEGSKVKPSPIIICWSTSGKYIENDKSLIYEFDLLLQNKGEEILRDLWVNFSSSGFKLELQQTQQTQLFQGWNVFNEGINLITKSDYRFAPQNFVCPFKIRVELSKVTQPEGAWLYFSFGALNIKKTELESKVTRENLKSFVNGQTKNTEALLKFLGIGKQSFT